MEIPSLESITSSLNVSAYEAFSHYLLTLGHDIDEFWKNVDDALITLIVGKANFISKYVERFKNRHMEWTPKTFELIRCDFILDENFNLFLMEVSDIRRISCVCAMTTRLTFFGLNFQMNMSPNLTPTRKVYEPQGAMYEKIVFHTANLVGIMHRDHSSM